MKALLFTLSISSVFGLSGCTVSIVADNKKADRSIAAVEASEAGSNDMKTRLNREETANELNTEPDPIIVQGVDALNPFRRPTDPSSEVATLRTPLQTSDGHEVLIINIARSILKSSEYLKSKNQWSIAGEGSLPTMSQEITSSNMHFSALFLVASKIENSNSAEGKAVIDLLVLGQEIAEGRIPLQKIHNLSSKMLLVTSLLLSRTAKTAEQALQEANLIMSGNPELLGH